MSAKPLTTLIPFLFVWLWSTGFVGARFGLPYIEPFFMLTARFAITIPCFLILILILRQNWLRRDQIGIQLLVGSLLHGVYLGGVFFAISQGMPAGISAIIVGLQPVLTALMNWGILGQPITLRQTFGLVMGFVGVVAVILGSVEISGFEGGYVGLITCLIALVAISASTVLQKRYAQDTPLVAGAMVQYIGAILVIGLASVLMETQSYTPAWELFVALGWLICALSIGAIVLLMYMIREGEVAKISSYFYLVPPVAALQTWILFDEALSLMSLIGCGVVVMGVALVVRK